MPEQKELQNFSLNSTQQLNFSDFRLRKKKDPKDFYIQDKEMDISPQPPRCSLVAHFWTATALKKAVP